MEHAALHGAQLIGMLLALAAPLLALLALRPALATAEGARTAVLDRAVGAPDEPLRTRDLAPDAAGDLARSLAESLARWACRGAAVAAIAALLNLVTQVAEIEGVTILAGAQPALLWRFATATMVGRLALARAGLLVATAVVAARVASERDAIARPAPWLAIAAPAFAAIVLASLVSHAGALPQGRAVALALEIAHLTAAGLWIGALTHLLAARQLLRGARSPGEIALVSEVVRRFSPLALAAAATLLASGAIGAWANLAVPSALLTSAYGLTLLVKLLLLSILLVPAWVNFRVVRPALLRAAAAPAGAGAGATLARLAHMIELEVTAGLLVVAVAGILGSVSPPLPDGTGRLSTEQIASIATPRLPQTQVVDPATWTGSETRTDDDLRYSEFMHNWSGLIVILLGLAWLLQSTGGPAAERVGRLWPLALIPFALFIAIASDPEVWPMGTVGPIAALTDPIVLEHRIGALMVVVLAWLGLREERRGGEDRPLGRALPILMIVGSLLLLGHAHSSLGATEALTTLINVQHAVLGGLGLLAGTVRWLELRELFPRRAARVLWPSLVIAVGVFMAFSYREITV